MPYNTKDDSKLPTYVKKLPEDIRARWVAVFNSTYEDEGEEVAFIVANSWLKRKLKEKRQAARTGHRMDIITFEIDESKEFISRTEDGEEYVSFKLADVFKDKFGVQLTSNVLQKWADAINSGDTVLGDSDHEYYDQLLKLGYSEDEIKAAIKKKPSLAKAVQAVVDKGRLWVKALIDKRYKKQIQNSKGVSLEAIITRDSNDQVVDADLLGFTFGIKHDPVISGTEVYA